MRGACTSEKEGQLLTQSEEGKIGRGESLPHFWGKGLNYVSRLPQDEGGEKKNSLRSAKI